MAGISRISPESRQMIYLGTAQAGVKGGKFITETAGNRLDPDVPSDIVNRTPPQDGRIASADNPFAFKLDGPTDEFGNEWKAHSVRSGDAVAFSIGFDSPVKVRRVTAYITKQNWNPSQALTRAQFDLPNPPYRRTFPAAPYHDANERIPVGVVAESLEFALNLPRRAAGRHVLLLEIDHPDGTEATYQVIDLNYIG
ncbi:lytic polysaccharide monooxygenase [Streptomyces sp. NPDC023588]|uniref:lytic polysaccharide monooxygenase n=1 Tax=Streptomyces sp. NPDC023588 TaxID=3154907 RepID=UPI0033FB0303